MYQAVIFDFDYTLGDSTPGIVQSVGFALSKLQEEPKSAEAIRRTIGLSLADTYHVLTKNQSEEKAALFEKYFKQKADEVMVANTQIYEPVKEVFAFLKEAGCSIGVVTTKYHHRIEAILKKFNLCDMVTIIVGGDDVKTPKPSPEGLCYVMQELCLEKEDILYVGDNVVDAKAAESAELDFAAVLTGTTTAKDFAKFAKVCIADDLYGILAFLKGERQ